ncbi:MAG TPA: hypothetical protein VJV23_07270, partial [Candidatus Polarisedimenticolia bacterium]|nr:hypothetical protein [Candidatus Polarisedimenticolia bacterium]
MGSSRILFVTDRPAAASAALRGPGSSAFLPVGLEEASRALSRGGGGVLGVVWHTARGPRDARAAAAARSRRDLPFVCWSPASRAAVGANGRPSGPFR